MFPHLTGSWLLQDSLFLFPSNCLIVMAPTIQDHVFSVPGAQAEIFQRYNIFKNLEIVYHPDNYDASVLVANKEEFINEVNAYKELATFTVGVITNVAFSAVDKTIAQDFLSSSGREFSAFLNLYSRKCLNTIVGETEAAIEKIQEEDCVLCLYSGLDKSKVLPRKYPTFSGSLFEDYTKWEKETCDTLVRTRPSSSSQTT